MWLLDLLAALGFAFGVVGVVTFVSNLRDRWNEIFHRLDALESQLYKLRHGDDIDERVGSFEDD